MKRCVVVALVTVGFFLPVPSRASGLIEARSLARERGWTEVHWTPGEALAGLCVEVGGRAEFRQAEILFSDGAVERVALAGARRGRGLYALAEFPAERGVERVTLVARARSARAEVAIRLVKVAPAALRAAR